MDGAVSGGRVALKWLVIVLAPLVAGLVISPKNFGLLLLRSSEALLVEWPLRLLSAPLLTMGVNAGISKLGEGKVRSITGDSSNSNIAFDFVSAKGGAGIETSCD